MTYDQLSSFSFLLLLLLLKLGELSDMFSNRHIAVVHIKLEVMSNILDRFTGIAWLDSYEWKHGLDS